MRKRGQSKPLSYNHNKPDPRHMSSSGGGEQSPFTIHYQKVHIPDLSAMTDSYYRKRQDIRDDLARFRAQYKILMAAKLLQKDNHEVARDNRDMDERTKATDEDDSDVYDAVNDAVNDAVKDAVYGGAEGDDETSETAADRWVFDDFGMYSKEVFLADEAADYCPYRFDAIQSYHPLLQHFFVMTADNYHKVALNHTEQMHTLDQVINTETRHLCDREVFIKFAPMLDPYQFLSGKYNMERQSWRQLPQLHSVVDGDEVNSDECRTSSTAPLTPQASHPKLMDLNNCSYVDMFFTYLLGKLREQHKLIFAQRFYGAFLGIQEKFRYNIAMELECLEYSSFFRSNNGKFFTCQEPVPQLYNDMSPPLPHSLPLSSSTSLPLSATATAELLDPATALTPFVDDSLGCTETVAAGTSVSPSEAVVVKEDAEACMEEIQWSTDTLWPLETASHNNADSTAAAAAAATVTASSDLLSPPAAPLLRLQGRRRPHAGTCNLMASSFFSRDDTDDTSMHDGGDSSVSDVDSLYSNSDEGSEISEVDQDKDKTKLRPSTTAAPSSPRSLSERESIGNHYDDDEEDEYVPCYLHNFPVMMIAQDRCTGTLDELLPMSEDETLSALIQVVMMLLAYQKMFDFTHNDLHSNNIMYTLTDRHYLYYIYDKQLYKVPTFGRIYHIIDFGRAIYRFKDRLFCSDSFQPKVGDAFAQYNTEPYFDPSKPRIDPNRSFDLCRLGCSLYPKLVPCQDWCKPLPKGCSPVLRLVLRWCTDDFGKNILLKRDGTERYAGFKLYKMIARTVTHRTPQAEIRMPEFARFIVRHPLAQKLSNAVPMNLDSLPLYYQLATPHTGGGGGSSSIPSDAS